MSVESDILSLEDDIKSKFETLINLYRLSGRKWAVHSVYGNIVDLLNPKIDLEKCFRSLPKINRYNGDSPIVFSVGHHLLLCARLVNYLYKSKDGIALFNKNIDTAVDYNKLVFACLTHDFSEAFIGDIIRPIKHLSIMSPIRHIEDTIEFELYRQIGFVLPESYKALVKAVDMLSLCVEAHYFSRLVGSSFGDMTDAWQEEFNNCPFIRNIDDCLIIADAVNLEELASYDPFKVEHMLRSSFHIYAKQALTV